MLTHYCSSRNLLAFIITLHTLLLVVWIIREMDQFDIQCVLTRHHSAIEDAPQVSNSINQEVDTHDNNRLESPHTFRFRRDPEYLEPSTSSTRERELLKDLLLHVNRSLKSTNDLNSKSETDSGQRIISGAAPRRIFQFHKRKVQPTDPLKVTTDLKLDHFDPLQKKKSSIESTVRNLSSMRDGIGKPDGEIYRLDKLGAIKSLNGDHDWICLWKSVAENKMSLLDHSELTTVYQAQEVKGRRYWNAETMSRKSKRELDSIAARNTKEQSSTNTVLRRMQIEKFEKFDHQKVKRKRFLLLGEATTVDIRNINAKSNSWFHGIINPNDRRFSNRGDIRIYQGQIASSKPKANGTKFRKQSTESSVSIKPSKNNGWKSGTIEMMHNVSPVNAFDSYTSQSTLISKSSMNDEDEVESNNVQRLHTATTKGRKWKQNSVGNSDSTQSSHSNSHNSIDTWLTSTTTKYSTGVSRQNYNRDEKFYRMELWESYPQLKLKNTTWAIYRKEQEYKANRYGTYDFPEQMRIFSSMALCMTRFIFGVWCIADCIAAVPFFIGLCYPFKCLFAGHIILATLLILIAIVYSSTIAIYSVILYGTIQKMSFQDLLEWIALSASINFFLIIYLICFILTIKCCESLVEKKGRKFG